MLKKFYTYENFDLNLNSASCLFIIGGIYIGILLGVALSLIVRVHSHRIVKALVDRGALDRDHAATLDDLGLGKNPFVRRMLREDGSLRRLVLCANEEDFPERKLSPLRRFWHDKFLRDPLPPKTDFALARFYLPEEKRVTAEVRFPAEGHPVRSFVLALIGLSAAAAFTVFALPELLAMLDNFITQVKPASKFY